MNVVWQKSFEFVYSVDRVWTGYLEMQGTTEAPPPGTTFTLPDATSTLIEITEVATHERISWSETKPDDKAEMTMAFESIETGTRVTITRYGFGEGAEFEIFRQSHPLGNEESMRDLAVYLQTGVLKRRHLTSERSSTGVAFLETPAGLEVVSAKDQSTLRPGDLLLSVDGAAIYGRSELWFLTRLYEPGIDVEFAFVRGGKVMAGPGRMKPLESAVVGELGLGPRVDE